MYENRGQQCMGTGVRIVWEQGSTMYGNRGQQCMGTGVSNVWEQADGFYSTRCHKFLNPRQYPTHLS